MASKYNLERQFQTIEVPNEGESILDPSTFEFVGLHEFLQGRRAHLFVVDASNQNTPDLISYLTYGTVRYWWVVCLANRIEDPYAQIPKGKRLAIPFLEDIEEFLLSQRNTGFQGSVNVSN